MSFNQIAVTQESANRRTGGILKGCSLIALFTLFMGTMAQAQLMVPSPSFPTISSAISAASPGSTILVAPGTYTGAITINKDIILQSTDGPEVTTITQNGNLPTVRFQFNNPNSPGGQVIGFRITGGNTVSANPGARGGGVACVSNRGTIKDCIITGNQSLGPNTGSGVDVFFSQSFKIINCIIYGNSIFTTPSVGGVASFGSTVAITNSTIANNLGTTSDGVHLVGSGNNVVIKNSIVRTSGPNPQFGNTLNLSIQASNVPGAGIFLGSGNINADPLFVDANGGDFHLMANSPCIDAVTGFAIDLPTTDFEGDPRSIGLAVDMGADESRVASIGNGQANSANARLEVNGLSTGSVIGPFSSPVNRGEYFTLDFSGAPNSLYELYASTILNPGGWDFGSFGFFDLGTGPSFADVFVLAPGFSATFPFYSIDAAGQSQLSFYVHPSVAVGPTISIQAIIQNPLPWTNGEFATLSAAHVLVVQ